MRIGCNPSNPFGCGPHHAEEAAQALVVGMDLEVVPEGGEAGACKVVTAPPNSERRYSGTPRSSSELLRSGTRLQQDAAVAEMVDARTRRRESVLDALGREVDGLNQFDGRVSAVAEGGVVNELRWLIPGADVLRRAPRSMGKKNGAELVHQATDGLLDVLDEVGEMVRFAEPCLEQVLGRCRPLWA